MFGWGGLLSFGLWDVVAVGAGAVFCGGHTAVLTYTALTVPEFTARDVTRAAGFVSPWMEGGTCRGGPGRQGSDSGPKAGQDDVPTGYPSFLRLTRLIVDLLYNGGPISCDCGLICRSALLINAVNSDELKGRLTSSDREGGRRVLVGRGLGEGGDVRREGLGRGRDLRLVTRVVRGAGGELRAGYNVPFLF